MSKSLFKKLCGYIIAGVVLWVGISVANVYLAKTEPVRLAAQKKAYEKSRYEYTLENGSGRSIDLLNEMDQKGWDFVAVTGSEFYFRRLKK